MAKYELIDCCPVPHKLAPILRVLKSRSGCTFTSIYRGTDSRDLLARCGKHDQAWLYANLPAGVANPPGRSTHELRSDGVAYPGPVGRPLKWWQCGIDMNDSGVSSFIRAAADLGYVATVTYPQSRVEYHHVNLRQNPYFARILKEGSIGPRVAYYTRALARMGIHLSHSHWHYDSNVAEAVRRFQGKGYVRKYHLAVDGVLGPHTAAALLTEYRRWKKEHPNGK